ncbi:MAG: glycosyltransferase family 4 protein [Planctomycetota bacterium]|nr:glycosyltransferase family 4 protein [Planctomycetota bacterium]
MKIAHVTPYFHPKYYGSHEAFLSKELAARGHEVTLFTSDRMPRWGGARGLSDAELEPGESMWEGVRIVRVPAGPTLSFVPSLPSLPGHLRRGDFDLFLSHEVFSLAAWHTARAARRAKKPFVLVQHGYHGGRRAIFRALFKLEFALFGRGVLRAADRIVSLTEKGADFLDELGAKADQVEVVPTGVDCALFEPEPTGGPFAEGGSPTGAPADGPAPLRVGFIGRIDEGKGVLDLLEAFAQAFPPTGAQPPGGGPLPQLEFAGTGDAQHLLRERATALGLASQVHFRGRIPHSDVPAFLAAQDVLCVPTREVEPFGIVAVEAAAAGIPCLATRIGGLQETVLDGRTGVLLEPGDVGALATSLGRLADEPAWRSELGQAARRRAFDTYDWPRITDRFESLFAAVA